MREIEIRKKIEIVTMRYKVKLLEIIIIRIIRNKTML